MAITLTNPLLRRYLEHACGEEPAPGKLHLLGIRSARLNAHPREVSVSLVEPKPNYYDDLVGYFGSALALYPGTVDPGRYYTDHPQHPAGCAHLIGCDEGGRPYAYARGLHKRKPAFVQAGSVLIWRDGDGDMERDPREQPVPARGIGLNIHRMGQIRSDIKLWSAGCQGVMDEWWETFWQVAAVEHPQPLWQYWLMDMGRFAAWHDGGQPS